MHSMLKIVDRLSRSIGTPLALEASKLLRQRDYSSLVDLTVHPSDYTNVFNYKLDAQVVALFRKLEGLPTGVDLHRKAVETFFKCEASCAETNRRLATYNGWFDNGFFGDAIDHKIYEHICYVRVLIKRVLGPVPKDLVPRLSGGSTYYDKGDEITIPHKMSSRPSVTPNCWETVADLWRGTAWYNAHHLAPVFIQGNRFTSVPKDSTKNRGICVEPSLCMGYQLAVGSDIRDKLFKITGIDIKGTNGAVNAQTVHRALAKQASMDGLLATLDLSNASDTVALQLVRLLLPGQWFDLLSSLRSPYTYIEGKWHKNHKFSSMGNGFTFELETLIFWALAKSVSDGYVSVYGDDIILPADDSRSLMSLLELFGFEVNKTKSFYSTSDPFRESCGGDYWNGESVRPVFLKVMPASPGEWMVLANHIRQIAISNYLNVELAHDAWVICVEQIPVRFRVYGPSWAGDGVIHSDIRAQWRLRPAELGYSFIGRPELTHRDLGYSELRVLETKQRKVSLADFSPAVQLASALLGTPSSGPIPRDGIVGYKLAWRPTVM